MGLRISHKLLILGLGSVLAAALVLVAVGAWQSSRFAGDITSHRAADELSATARRLTGLVSRFTVQV